MPIHYHIQPKNPAAHLFEVRCTVAHPDPQGQVFSMPTWIPGSYLIREFARHVGQVTAQCGDQPLAVTKLDKHTWRCAPCAGPLTISYPVYAFDSSVRSAYLDPRRGYFNGSAVFLMAHGMDTKPCRVDIVAGGADWRVATSLPAQGAKPYGFGRYQASNYADLIDHPVEMGHFDLLHFDACGVPHSMAVSGRHRADLERLGRDLKAICETHIRFFGEPAPMQRYLFLTQAVGEGYGGLEHAHSSSLICKRTHLPPQGQTDNQDPNQNAGYRGFLGLCSHEYFHTWWVKRVKPAAFSPYDLSREAYTRLLWVFEGITSYYDDLGLLRAGLIAPKTYLELLGQSATRLWRGSGRLKENLEESSFDAWIKFYRQDENASNAGISYYTKGALVALALDLLIRKRSSGAYSLDDVMRVLWRDFGRSSKGLAEGDFERIASAVTDLDLQTFFDMALRSTEELPLKQILAPFGVDFSLRAADSDQDTGGQRNGKGPAQRAVLGAKISSEGNEVKLTQIFDDGAAQAAGLAAGDLIVALDGIRASRDNLLTGYSPGQRVKIHAFRQDELLEFKVKLKAAPLDTCVFKWQEQIDAATESRRQAWLGGVCLSPLPLAGEGGPKGRERGR